jgi:hypothetical protein
MKHKILILQLVLFSLALFCHNALNAQIRRKPITPDLGTQGLPSNTPAPAEVNTAPASLPPIIIKQESEHKEVPIRKPVKGNFTAEGLLQFSFGDEPLMLKFTEIKARFFATDKLAYRGTLGFDIGSQTNDFIVDKNTASYTISNQSIRAGGGVEVHLKSSKRLSPYYGGEGLILLHTQKTSGTNTNDLKTYSLGAGYQSDSSYTGIYLGALAGLDCYITSDLFIGFEIGLGVTSFSTVTIGERTTLRGTTVTESNVVNGRGTQLGLRYSQGIRVGFKF